jgi:PAS domain S-box-containing protein
MNEVHNINDLIREWISLRQRLTELESSEAVQNWAEEIIGEADTKYRFLFEHSPTINLVIGVDGIIKDVNKNAVQQLGYTKSELIGQRAIDFVTPPSREKVSLFLERGFKGEETPEVEVDVYARDLSFRTILFSPGQVVLYKNKQPISILVTGIDTTERKWVEEALRASEERYRLLIDTMNDGFGVQDELGNFIYVNDRFAK